MSDDVEEAPRMGVRWRRAAGMNLVGMGLLAYMVSQLWTGTVMGLGAGLVFSGKQSQFSSAKLSTTNVGIGVVPVQLRDAASQTASKYALRMGFAGGTLDGFCVSQTESILGQDWTIRLTARDNQLNVNDVSGKNVQFDVSNVTSSSAPNTSGNGIVLRGNVALGVTPQTITTWKDAGGVDAVNPLDAPETYAGTNGRLFGIDSDVGDLYNVKGELYDAVIEGPLSLKNLKIEVLHASAATAGCKNIPIVY
ncbi:MULTISPECIES: DUF6230 family protein [unclassified Nocardioides]|uniref:DUF6230 family protein n=1 Tax=unclassified Nocardioides TaxID=2615069 RepID=UPI0006F61BB7|nr:MULTISPECIES: DUF6230 family protein [unclassified Nocardioides]KQY57049.1 hypothetical protein ASD30_12360 [Nocardioides sp. Root140]KRF11689.1 hypothetical protein ASH02_17005 [Nocardioides sp. Soil796]